MKTTYSSLLLFAGSLLALISAYITEFGFGILPCILCEYARIPFYLALLFSLFSFFIKHSMFFWMGLISVFSSGIISSIHAGIEYKLINIDFGCSAPSTTSLEDIMAISGNFIPCDQIQFSIFGISLSLLNVLYTVFLCIASVYIRKKYD